MRSKTQPCSCEGKWRYW